MDAGHFSAAEIESNSVIGYGNEWAPNALLKKRDFQEEANPPRTTEEFYARYDPSVGVGTAAFLVGFIGVIFAQACLKWSYKKYVYLSLWRQCNIGKWQHVEAPKRNASWHEVCAMSRELSSEHLLQKLNYQCGRFLGYRAPIDYNDYEAAVSVTTKRISSERRPIITFEDEMHMRQTRPHPVKSLPSSPRGRESTPQAQRQSSIDDCADRRERQTPIRTRCRPLSESSVDARNMPIVHVRSVTIVDPRDDVWQRWRDAEPHRREHTESAV